MSAWFPRVTVHSLAIVVSVLTYVLTTRAIRERRPPSIAIAWVLAKGEDIVALVGSSTPARLLEALGSLEVKLSADDIAELERAVPATAVLGDRYPALGMASLDSERA